MELNTYAYINVAIKSVLQCPYPRDEEKLMLAAETGMALNQVNNWCVCAMDISS